MTITYCRNDPISGRWVGVDRLLTEFEIDYNFYQHDTRIATLEANYTLTISIDTITQPTPSSLLITMTDATTQGPFEMPVASFRDRGDWEVSTPYLVNDTFNAPNGGLYRVLFDHTSDATSFDPNANDGSGHDYYASMIPPRGNTLPSGGATAQVLEKSSSTDYAVTWGYKLPIDGDARKYLIKQSGTNQDADWDTPLASDISFAPSTGSGLVSTNVAEALEELAVSPVDAIDVSFSPSSASSLTSTNVAAALEELETSITSPVGYLPLSGGTMTGALTLSGDPASSLQAVTKQYVDGIALNLGKRQSVRVATTANIVIASSLNSGDTIDGVTLATNDLVLVKNQSTPAQNGVYVVDVSPVRFGEFDTYDEHPGALIAVQEGTTNADSIWLCTSNAGGTLNTTPIVFSQSSSSGALLALNNLSDVPNPATARANLAIKESLALLTDVNVTEGAGIDGYALKWNQATGKWIAAVSTGGTTYSAGAGLALTGTTFSADINQQTIWIPATAMIARTTNGAASGTAEMTTNKNMVATLDFDSATQEFAQFEIAMPKSWNEGTITFIPYWSHAATTTNFGVVWGVDAVAISDDDTLDVAFGTAQTSTDTGGTTNDLYVGPESSAITVAGSPAAGDMVQFRIHRNPSDGSDTMAIDARLHGVKILYVIDALKDD